MVAYRDDRAIPEVPDWLLDVPVADGPAKSRRPDGGVMPTAQPRTYTVYSRAMLKLLPKPKWLHDPYLIVNSLALLVGTAGAGKSFCAVDWAAQVEGAGKVVLYLAAEGAEGLDQRLTAWERRHGRDLVHVYTIPEACNLLADADVQALADTVMLKLPELVTDAEGRRVMPALIVVDTLARSLVGGDENSAKDMGIAVEQCEKIRRATGACVLLIHHTNKAGGVRGSTALLGAMETAVELATNDDKTIITLTVIKQKNRKEAVPATYQLEVEAWQEEVEGVPEELDSCVFVPRASVEEQTGRYSLGAEQISILQILGSPATGGQASLAVLMERAGIAKRNVAWNRLDSLIKKGLVQKPPTPRSGYTLSEEGQQWVIWHEGSKG